MFLTKQQVLPEKVSSRCVLDERVVADVSTDPFAGCAEANQTPLGYAMSVGRIVVEHVAETAA